MSEDERTRLRSARIHISGIVQGVGFRPFVYHLATRLGLTGWVRNTSAGVDILVDGSEEVLRSFLQALQREAPALARIDECRVEWGAANGFTTFEIVHSQAEEGAFQPISPDVSICEDCLRELFDPLDRRYRYPFINCTNCGPRFTIIKSVPYDRPNTTMAVFPLCSACAAEYEDPTDRRFHAQPVACPQCGPHVWLEKGATGRVSAERDEAILAARDLLRQGYIVAIKGLGGFHLACDATNPLAVQELRRRKLRVDKPFALMMPDRNMVEAHCWLSAAERALLERRERPILILRRREDSPIAAEVAPNQNTLGVMLPYTPLHYLLFAAPHSQPVTFDMPPLVMTSGNLSEEPLCYDNEEARRRLGALADAFLMHNREIYMRCDDAVVRMFPALAAEGERVRRSPLYPLRRARGFAPDPIPLPWETIPLLATGAELKNTFCLTRGRYAFLSHHIGDMQNYETLRSFEEGVLHYERLFRIQPQAIACDLHPDYLASRYAGERAARENLPLIAVQHHHAHIAACLADNGWKGEGPVIGVAYDGAGLGEDGAIWGGEFLLADYHSYQRVAHLSYVPQPGGDLAVREPWRMALAWLRAAGLPWEDDLPPVAYARQLSSRKEMPILEVVCRQIEQGVNTVLTSSMGRLFDAVAALCGVRQWVNYEAQAAVELEALAEGRETAYYSFDIEGDVISARTLWQQLVADLRAGESPAVMAARFHGGVAQMTVEVCRRLRQATGSHEVALSGGVWQNMLLLALTVGLLQGEGFRVYLHRQVPANDGGLALGQAAVAWTRLREG